jgi:hypothetical protein
MRSRPTQRNRPFAVRDAMIETDACDAGSEGVEGRSLVDGERTPSEVALRRDRAEHWPDRFVLTISMPRVVDASAIGAHYDNGVLYLTGRSEDARPRSITINHTPKGHPPEAPAGGAAAGRDDAWKAGVIEALRRLQEALAERAASYDDPSSLIAYDDPRLPAVMRQFRDRCADLDKSVEAFRERLGGESGSIGLARLVAVRDQARWLITTLHHDRAEKPTPS